MARTVPGSGAVIEPIFDQIFGVRAVNVKNGGSGYDPADPPRLTVDGCGTPDEEAILYPIIDSDSGKIIHVRVLRRGRGYDPLRLQIIPEQETPNVITSFDVNRIWQTHPNSPTTGSFQTTTDRLRIVSDNHPKPTWTEAEAAPDGGPLVDRSFDQTFIYRGGKDVPNPGNREEQKNKVTGILANGGLLHTPEWGTTGGAPVGFSIDTVKYDYIKNNTVYDTVDDSNIQYYQSSKTIGQFALDNGVFDWGGLQQYTWNVKVEIGNIMLTVSNVDETLGSVEVGRIVDEISGAARGEIAKISRDGDGNITRIYLRNVSTGASFSDGDRCLGSNGFTFTISADPRSLNIYYIDFGPSAAKFGPFVPGQFYFAPENIRVKRNYLIIINQSDASNGSGISGHPIRFSTTQDGPLNQNPGTVYYKSSGVSEAPAADYENSYQPLFIMNADETNRIYYHCAYHRYMSGFEGDEGYILLDPATETYNSPNNYYTDNFYQSDANDPNTIDKSRHVDGHSKVLGMSYDGYPIYGPWGYNSSGAVAREVSSYRLRTTVELPGARGTIGVNTAGTVTYAVTLSNNEYQFDGSRPAFLNLERGKTYIFNCDDSSMDSNTLLFSTTSDGWHSTGDPADIGTTSYVYGDGISYYIDGSEVSYTAYLSGFSTATTRELRIAVRVDAPTALYVFSYASSGRGIRSVQDGYILGDLVEDYIYDSAQGTLDEYNGKFGPTPEYPNGTYAYYMTENSSGEPVYPYAIGPKYYSVPLFEGDTVPTLVEQFPQGAEGDVVLHEEDVYGFDNNGNSVVIAPAGSVAYVKMTKQGDGYFGPAKAKILGGEGSGALGTPIVQTVTGLSLLNNGREYASPPTVIFEGGGGGQGAQGAAEVDTTGKVTSVSIVDSGEFYQEPPYILITGGGGIGAKAVATVSQGEVTGITVTDPGEGYTTPPNVIFTKLVNLKRKTRARQANNSSTIYLTGLVKDVTASDTEIYVDSTDAYPGSGEFILNTETISYTSKSEGKFSGLTRGVNFNYDQRVILDDGQNDANGNSTYQFSVGDRVIRRVENANNKVAKVYDWNPATRELLVVFEVDELAFIDGGIPSTEDAIVQFDAGVAASSGAGILPHVVVTSVGESIPLLTEPLSTLTDRDFEDDDEQDGAGDGIPDLVNTGTDFLNQISLDGGIYNSLYGIEETQGGQNTTLFQVGDSVKDASIPFKYATISTAGGLSEGVEHNAIINIHLDANDGNGQNYSVNEIVTGDISGVRGTVVSWDPNTSILQVQDVVPYNTGNVNIGIGGYFYEFSEKNTIKDIYIQNAGTNYTATPTVTIENTGDIQATGTVNMTTAGDQVASITITNGGYGIPQTVDGTYNLHPTITFTNDASDTTGSGAVAYAILGGEKLAGNGGASYRIKRIDYQVIVRS
tara:strand:- start:437 stop:4654 length:4218 start_codon:yes stop_codon:yes gene_type:complete